MAPDRGKSNKFGASRAWDALNPPLSPWILDSVSSLGFSAMTPVQASTIPLFMGYKDVVVEAVTGSGKTLAFLIPIVEKLLRLDAPIPKHHVGAIVISPTRELASQIHQVLRSLLDFHNLPATTRDSPSIENASSQGNLEDLGTPSEDGSSSRLRIVPQLLVGGSSSPAQDLSKFLKTSPNLLVSTPGRLLEILSSPYVHCPQSSFEVLVLDEADRLLDLGFKEDLTKILNLLPKQRRTGLFSASVSEAVDQIIRVGLRNPVRIAVKVKGTNGAEDRRTPASLQMTYAVYPPAHKIPALSKLLRQLDPSPNKTIVYLSTCAAVDYFQALLPPVLPDGMLLVPLHGKQASNVRQKNFVRFTNAATQAVLLTTDVAARGLDIPAVDLVVQLDPPSDPKVFLHRCGRAGRAGRKGLSVIFLRPGREEDYVSFLEVRQTPIEHLNSPAIAVTDTEAAKIIADFRKTVLKDRGHHDNAQKAFVSWVRSYSKHQASSIFRVADLDWAQLADAWALLKIPKMPELKNWDRQGYRPVVVDWDNYAYMDKQHEKQRREALAKFQAEGPSAVMTDNPRKRRSAAAWSEKLQHKADKEMQREKKQARREYERKAKMTEAERTEMEKTEQMVDEVRVEQKKKRKEKEEVFEGFD